MCFLVPSPQTKSLQCANFSRITEKSNAFLDFCGLYPRKQTATPRLPRQYLFQRRWSISTRTTSRIFTPCWRITSFLKKTTSDCSAYGGLRITSKPSDNVVDPWEQWESIALEESFLFRVRYGTAKRLPTASRRNRGIF